MVSPAHDPSVRAFLRVAGALFWVADGRSSPRNLPIGEVALPRHVRRGSVSRVGSHKRGRPSATHRHVYPRPPLPSYLAAGGSLRPAAWAGKSCAGGRSSRRPKLSEPRWCRSPRRHGWAAGTWRRSLVAPPPYVPDGATFVAQWVRVAGAAVRRVLDEVDVCAPLARCHGGEDRGDRSAFGHGTGPRPYRWATACGQSYRSRSGPLTETVMPTRRGSWSGLPQRKEEQMQGSPDSSRQSTRVRCGAARRCQRTPTSPPNPSPVPVPDA